MSNKTINQFVKEMKEQFGENIEMKITAPDGSVFRQTKGWLTDEQLSRSEKLLKLKSNGNSYGGTLNDRKK